VHDELITSEVENWSALNSRHRGTVLEEQLDGLLQIQKPVNHVDDLARRLPENLSDRPRDGLLG
jgi:hypothetical protein